MGGSIAMTLRLPDGTEHRMMRWTNIMPWAFTNLDLVTENPEHLKAFMSQWHEMVEDWDTAQAAGTEPKFLMTSCYAPYRLLAPDGYGLVVIDMVNKVILHSQGYSDIGTIFTSSFHDGEFTDPDSNKYRFKKLWDAGRIKSIKRWSAEGVSVIPVPWSTAEEAVEALHSSREWMGDFIVDMSPYTVERFPEHNTKEAIRLRERVLSLGFALTAPEEAQWAKWIEDCKEYDKEYDDDGEEDECDDEPNPA